jgi:RHS repeat-associated protein
MVSFDYGYNNYLGRTNSYSAHLVRGEQSFDALAVVTVPAITAVTPVAARLDIPQTFTITGTNLTAGMGFAIEDCEGVTEVTAGGLASANQRQFSCTPRLPGAKNVIVKTVPNGTPLFTSAAPATTGAVPITIDHPARLGNPSSRGIPAVQGVSLWNGNYHLRVTDLSVPGKGLPFTVSRTYNSYYSPYELARGSVDNYHPWRFNWDLSVQYVPNTGKLQLSVDREDGSGEGFYKDKDGNWYAINQGGLSLLRTETPSAGLLTLTTRDGRNYVFDNPDLGGKLQYVADHDDFRLTLEYGANGKVSTVTDTVGRVHTFSYHPGTTNLKSVTDASGRSVSYTWESDTAPNTGDPRDRLWQVVDVRGKTTTYNYRSNDSASEPRVFLASIDDARGKKVLQLTHAKAAYGNWGVTSLVDASLNTWGFQFCSNTTITEVCAASPPANTDSFVTKVTAPLVSANFKSHFDLAGRYMGKTDALAHRLKVNPWPTANLTPRTWAMAGLVQSRQTAEGVANNYKTQYDYTTDSNLRLQTNPDTGQRENTWLPGPSTAPNCYKLTQTKSPQVVVRTMDYNATCKLTTTSVGSLPPSVNTYDPTSKLLSKTADPLGNGTEYTYTIDGLFNVASERNALGQVTSYIYDPLGRVVSKTAPGGLVTLYEYDEAGNLTQERRDPTGLNLITQYRYDENGNQTEVINPRQVNNPLLGKTLTVYDNANRVSTVTRTNQGVASTTTTHYDELGRVDSVTNANQHASTTAYGPAGNLSWRSDAMARKTTYDLYDADNRLKQQTDPEGRVTQYDYDPLGRVTKVTTPDGFTLTSYDTDGRVTSQTDKNGIVTTFGYDPDTGWRNRVTNAFGTPDATTTGMSYYANGLLNTVTDPRGNVTTYAYDALGRRTSITGPAPSNRVWTTAYDVAGNIDFTLDPMGNKAKHSYDKANRRTGTVWSINATATTPGTPTSTVSYVPDENGNITSKTDSTGTTAPISYDGMDRVTSVTDPRGQTVGYDYDPGSNIVTLKYPGGKNVIYGYDLAERMTSVKDWVNPLQPTTFKLDKSDRVTAISRRNGTSTTMGYDPAGRLNSLVHRKPDNSVIASHSITLRDANGNIQTDDNVLPLQPSLTAGTLTRTYDTDNRQDGIVHDAAGRVTNNGAYTLGWNEREQVSSINGQAQTYTADGLRVAEVAGGVATRAVFDTNASLPNLLIETNASNTPLRYYIHSPYGLVEQIDAAGNAFFYHFDPSGNTRALTNASGQVSDTYAYTPFGVTTRGPGNTSTNPFQFVGQYGVRNFNNTQLYDMRARWYSADQARFMSLDPLMGKADDAQTLNRYAYATGNPVMGVDPSGNYGENLANDQKKLYSDTWSEVESRQAWNAREHADWPLHKFFFSAGIFSLAELSILGGSSTNVILNAVGEIGARSASGIDQDYRIARADTYAMQGCIGIGIDVGQLFSGTAEVKIAERAPNAGVYFLKGFSGLGNKSKNLVTGAKNISQFGSYGKDLGLVMYEAATDEDTRSSCKLLFKASPGILDVPNTIGSWYGRWSKYQEQGVQDAFDLWYGE